MIVRNAAISATLISTCTSPVTMNTESTPSVIKTSWITAATAAMP